jgi:myo-inositol-1(or 4)-monophosphatase
MLFAGLNEACGHPRTFPEPLTLAKARLVRSADLLRGCRTRVVIRTERIAKSWGYDVLLWHNYISPHQTAPDLLAPQRTAFYGFCQPNASEHSTGAKIALALASKSAKMRDFMHSREECEHALGVAERVARDAGALVFEGWRGRTTISYKGKFDLLTEYDLRSEQLIRDELTQAFPEHRIVGEENSETGDGDLVWYVDPIDGTTNFAHGHPFFCVSIALYDGAEGLAGVVHAPALGTTWKASKHSGAFRNGDRCEVSARASLEEALCATGFPYDRWTNPDNNHEELALFLRRARGIRRCGSAAIDLCLVADGTYDIYWEQGLNAWDMCAGALMVLEAGGQLSTYDGVTVDPRSGKLIATNGLLHDAAVRTVREARYEVERQNP